MQIVFAQDQAERLHGKRITAAGVAQNVAPSAGSLDAIASRPAHGCPASSVYHNPVGMIESRGQPRLAVTGCDDLGVWPDLERNLSSRAAILIRCATRKENSSAIDLLRQFGKDGPQTFGRREPKIRWRQFSLTENAEFGAECVHHSLGQYPCGFRAAAFHPEDALTRFHDGVSLTASKTI